MVPGVNKPVCHLNIAPAYRGGERQAELLIRELAGRGWPQRLVIKRGNSLAERSADIPNLEVVEVARNPVAAGLAVRGSSLAHSHEARTVYSCLLAKWLFRVPYVLTRRVVAAQSPSLIRNCAYRRASAIAAVSRAAAANVSERMPDIDVKVVPDATTGFEQEQSATAAIRDARPGKTLIGHVGALSDSHKGQSLIIEAARRAITEHPDWHFLLCGDGPDEALLREQIGDLDNVELVGWVDNVGDYLAAFDLFVYPSRHEALGSTLLDAMRFGLAVVAAEVGGIPDFVVDGINGRLVQPDNAAALYAGIEELLGNGEMRRAMQARNVDHAAHYDAAHMADAYETLYHEILAQV